MMEQQWSFFKKVGFLFLFFYFFIYANSSQFIFSDWIEPVWQKVIPWFANLVGHDTPITVFANGSGDTTYNYYQILFFVVLSAILALVVSLIDSKRKNYGVLFRWTTLLVRYYLAAQMINYGLAKLYYMQFSFPSAARLDQELGDFSPMGLLWTFMGYSKGYTMFTGAMEVIGGLLLLTRKTTTLGALTTFGVMLNVMMLNYCYDVPVKLLSTSMVIMSIFLIALDGKRLRSFFFANQATEPYILGSIVPAKYERAKNIVKWILITVYLGFSIYQSNQMSKLYGPNAPKPMLYGKYAVESFFKYDDSLRLVTVPDSVRWASYYQKWDGYGSVVTGSDDKMYFNIKKDSFENKLNITVGRDTVVQNLLFERLDSNRYHIYGKFRQDSLDMIFRKEDLNQRLLVNRGFNWINEYPFNR